MSRRINEDFNKFVTFTQEYHFSLNSNQIERYKPMHKKLYAFLIIVAEMKNQCHDAKSIVFLEEAASDIMTAFFCIAQGLYKAGKLQLRCSIENFLKALILITTPNITEEKVVNNIFIIAKQDRHFTNSFASQLLDFIQNDYKLLCETVHGNLATFHPISALSLLPQYDEDLLSECIDLYSKTVESFLGILYINYCICVDQMHPENKKDFLDCISKTTKGNVIESLFSNK